MLIPAIPLEDADDRRLPGARLVAIDRQGLVHEEAEVLDLVGTQGESQSAHLNVSVLFARISLPMRVLPLPNAVECA